MVITEKTMVFIYGEHLDTVTREVCFQRSTYGDGFHWRTSCFQRSTYGDGFQWRTSCSAILGVIPGNVTSDVYWVYSR